MIQILVYLLWASLISSIVCVALAALAGGDGPAGALLAAAALSVAACTCAVVAICISAGVGVEGSRSALWWHVVPAAGVVATVAIGLVARRAMR